MLAVCDPPSVRLIIILACSNPYSLLTPLLRKGEESRCPGSGGLATLCLQNFVFLQEAALRIPLRGPLGYKIDLPLFCKLIPLFPL